MFKGKIMKENESNEPKPRESSQDNSYDGTPSLVPPNEIIRMITYHIPMTSGFLYRCDFEM